MSTNNVLALMGKHVEVLNGVKKRKLEYLGHVMRNKKYNLLRLVIQDKIVRKLTENTMVKKSLTLVRP